MAIVSKNKLLILLLVVCSAVKGQDKLSDIFEKLLTGTYYSNYEASLEFKVVNDKLVYDYSVVKEATYPTDKPTYSWAQSITYSEYYTSNVKRYAEVLIMKRPGHYRTIKIDDFAKKTVTSQGIFYEDQIQESFYMPTTRPGTISRLHFSYTGNDPMLTSRMLFNMEIPADRIVYKVIIPDNVKARFVFVGDTAGVVHNEKRIKEKTVHTYSTTGRKAIVFEDDAEDLTYYTPHLFVLPVTYTVAGKEIKAGGNLPNLFTYYNTHVKAIKDADNTELNRVTDSLVAHVTDTLTKIKIIYSWVQKHIKYVAFEEGPNGFIPRPAAKILSNRYGDCKDKTNILINMLARAGVKANYSWIGTRHKPYSYEQLPSPHADNHMIVSLQYKGRWLFLDATALAAEYDYPSSFIQGKEALIRLSDTSYTVQQIPIVDAQRSRKVDSLFLRIEKDEIVGYGTQKTSGYFKEDYNNMLLNALNTEDPLRGEIDFGNNKLSVADFKVNTEEDKDLTLQYKFKLSNYLQTYDKDMYLNLNLIKDMDKRSISVEDRKHGITNDYKYELVQHIQLDLPPGKQVDDMPVNKSFSNEMFSFEIKYEKKNDKVIYEKKIVINHLLLSTESFKDWNEMVENLNKAYTEAIIIKSK